jgi:exodeoxyribonuclease-5
MSFKKLKSVIDKKKEDIVKPENRNDELTIVNDSDIYGAWSSKGFDISTTPNFANTPVSAEEIDKIPRECSGIPYPLSNEQYKAVKNIIKWVNDISNYLSTSYDYEAPFRRLAGYAGCVDEESLILTNKGIMPIKDIILLQRNDLNFLGFEKFNEELLVFSHDKTWNPVTDIYATKENTKGYLIRTKSGNQIKCSWKHPLYTLSKNGEYQWSKAIDLLIGQQVAIYTNNDIHEFSDDTLMEFIGYYFADGYIDESNNILKFTSKSKSYLESWVQKINELFDLKYYGMTYRESKHTYQISFKIHKASKFFEIINKFNLLNKEFTYLTQLNLNQIKSFLNGLFRDITIDCNTLQFSNKFESNVRIVKNYLYLLGIKTGDIKFKSNKYSGTYRLNILSEDINRFIQYFGDREVKKGNSNRKVSDIIKNKSRNTNLNVIKNIEDLLTESGGFSTFGTAYNGMVSRNRGITYNKLSLGLEKSTKIKAICKDKFFWDEIISIEPIKQKFYDITVKDKASFICNNMVSHNTGKTACISYLLTEGYKYFPSYMREKEIAVCTFTWKAALVLQARGIYQASSIHGLLYKPQENDKGELYFVRRDKFEVMSMFSMIVVDEASMVDRKMRRDIQSYGIPVLYVGDKGQLPPISNNPADALIDNNFMAEAEDSLEEINRQAKDSPIIRLSMDIRNGKRINYGKYGKGVFKITEEELIDEQNELLPKMSQIICGTNDCRRAANSFMRRLYGYNRKRMPVKGEKLIGLSNVLDKGLYNGQAWLCDDEDASSYSLSDSKNVNLSLKSPDNSDRRLTNCIFPEDNLFKTERMSEAQIFKYLKDMEIYSIDFGYCITCHKSQGSSFDKVLVFEEKIGDREFHKKWLYTAVTRAVSKLIIVS